MVVTDVKRRIKIMNPVAEAMLGCKQDQAIGKDIMEMLSSEGAQILPFSKRPPAGPDALAGDIDQALYKTKGKPSATIEETVIHIDDERQKIQGNVLIFRNIEDRRSDER